MRTSYVLLAVLALFFSCNHPGLNEEQKKQVREGKRSREIKRISELEILEAAKKRGQEITSTLKTKMDTSAIDFSAIWLADSVNTQDPKIKQLIDAYQYARDSDTPASIHIEDLNNGQILFAMPAEQGIWLIYLTKSEIVRTI